MFNVGIEFKAKFKGMDVLDELLVESIKLLVCVSFNRNGSSSCDAFKSEAVTAASEESRPVAAVTFIDDEDEERLYVLDVFPIFTTVFSLLFRDATKIEDVLASDGISHIMRIAASARIEPNKNGGPGKRCFKNINF